MTHGTGGRLRIAVLVLLGAAYALAAHWFTSRPGLAEYGAILSIAPWLAVGAALAWQSSHRAIAVVASLAALAALYLARGVLVENFVWIYFIQHAGTFLALAVTFGRTLAVAREPLCTRLARVVHGGMNDELARYTRQVTLAWAVFFVAMCVVSTALFVLAPIAAWSLFANLLTPALVAAMFGVEYLIRLRVLPRLEHRGLIESARAFWSAPPSDAAPGESR
jgi:uncharacterized membrane protein